MAQKSVTEPDIAMRAVNKSGNIRQSQPPVIRIFDYAHDRMQGGKRIWCDFGFRITQIGNKRRLSGIRITDQTGIGDHFQLKLQLTFFALASTFKFARSAVGAGGEVDITPAASAAIGNDCLRTVFIEVGDNFAGIKVTHHGSDWNFKDKIVAFMTIETFSGTVGSVFGTVTAFEHQRNQTRFTGGSL